ncbi:MAG: hypothetical protein HOE90_22305 [Bacteriovoracaceae bacterium]|jgi:hypothetical protein|nr:hypothetical protein [Bacteriovoracaceae bacterium]
MKTKLLGLILLAFSMGISSQASASTDLWNCALKFNLKGRGAQIIFGSFSLKGKGEITCVSLEGDVETSDVFIKIGGRPLGLRIALGRYSVVGGGYNIAVSDGVDSLLGNYAVVNMTGSLGTGAGATIAAISNENSLGLNLTLEAVNGFGINVGLSRMSIERI